MIMMYTWYNSLDLCHISREPTCGIFQRFKNENVVRSIAHLVYPISPPIQRFCKHWYYTILSYMIFKENTQELHNHHVKGIFIQARTCGVADGRLI